MTYRGVNTLGKDAGHADPDMVEEVAALGRNNRVAQDLGNVVVLRNGAALGGKLPDQFATSCVKARNRGWRVLIQLGNDGQIGRVGEENACDCPKQRSDAKRAR